MRLPLQEYPWVDLAGGRRSFSFSADGSYARWKMSFTVSGIPEEGALIVKLDGQALDWSPSKPPGAERPDGSTMDRQFYHFEGTTLSSGTHTVTFESGFAPPSGAPIRQLCSVTLHEFGSDADFNNQEGYIGAYPTWDSSGRKTYRPTNDMCLMRTMESTKFCPICKEGMWQQFLQRMSLVDDVEVSISGGTVDVQLKAVPLAQLREVPVPGLTESYSVVWTKDGQRQDQLGDQFTFTGTEEDLAGSWEVELTLSSSEVRSDPSGLLTSNRAFSVGSSPSPSPSPSPPGGCTDLDSEYDCNRWSDSGYCSPSSQYYDYMMENCCSTCSGSCQDLNSGCPGWAGAGYCSPSSQYYQYMMENCCASCNR